jgi:hypothetical protein
MVVIECEGIRSMVLKVVQISESEAQFVVNLMNSSVFLLRVVCTSHVTRHRRFLSGQAL